MTRNRKDTNKCQLCGSEAGAVLERHHVAAVSEGGGGQSWNILHVCSNCHTLVHRFRRLEKGTIKEGKDTGTCDLCGMVTKTVLEIHHVLPHGEGNEPWKTLHVCSKCHGLIHCFKDLEKEKRTDKRRHEKRKGMDDILSEAYLCERCGEFQIGEHWEVEAWAHSDHFGRSEDETKLCPRCFKEFYQLFAQFLKR